MMGHETLITYGCTDPSMFNYWHEAHTDDGSCYPFVEGCMDVNSCNYDSSANVDEGCEYPAAANLDCSGACLNDEDGDGVCDENEIDGCTDSLAINFDLEATEFDDSCIPFIYGCMSDWADNFNDFDNDGLPNPLTDIELNVNTDDGSCYVKAVLMNGQ